MTSSHHRLETSSERRERKYSRSSRSSEKWAEVKKAVMTIVTIIRLPWLKSKRSSEDELSKKKVFGTPCFPLFLIAEDALIQFQSSLKIPSRTWSGCHGCREHLCGFSVISPVTLLHCIT